MRKVGKKKRIPENPAEEIDVLLAKRDKHTRRKAKADAQYAKELRRLEKRHAQRLGKSPQKIAKIDRQLADLAFEHRSWLMLQFSKTIRRARGVLRFVQQPPKLVMPKDTTPVIEFMQQRRNGGRYLDWTPKLNLTKIAAGPDSLKHELRERFGMDYGPHLTVLVQSPIEEHARTIGEQRNKVWPRKRK